MLIKMAACADQQASSGPPAHAHTQDKALGAQRTGIRRPERHGASRGKALTCTALQNHLQGWHCPPGSQLAPQLLPLRQCQQQRKALPRRPVPLPPPPLPHLLQSHGPCASVSQPRQFALSMQACALAGVRMVPGSMNGHGKHDPCSGSTHLGRLASGPAAAPPAAAAAPPAAAAGVPAPAPAKAPARCVADAGATTSVGKACAMRLRTAWVAVTRSGGGSNTDRATRSVSGGSTCQGRMSEGGYYLRTCAQYGSREGLVWGDDHMIHMTRLWALHQANYTKAKQLGGRCTRVGPSAHLRLWPLHSPLGQRQHHAPELGVGRVLRPQPLPAAAPRPPCCCCRWPRLGGGGLRGGALRHALAHRCPTAQVQRSHKVLGSGQLLGPAVQGK